jgi:hypothetical protein
MSRLKKLKLPRSNLTGSLDQKQTKEIYAIRIYTATVAVKIYLVKNSVLLIIVGMLSVLFALLSTLRLKYMMVKFFKFLACRRAVMKDLLNKKCYNSVLVPVTSFRNT